MIERIQIAVTATNEERIKERLAAMRKEDGPKATQLSDIFAVAVCIADYELIVDPDSVLAVDDITVLKDILVSAQYMCGATPVEPGKKMYVYHDGLEKIFMLKITKHGAEGYVHVHPMEVEDDNFELEHFRQTIKAGVNSQSPGIPQKQYHIRDVLVGSDEECKGELIDAMGLGYLEEENNVILLPFQKNSTKEDLIALGLMNEQGDRIRHDYK